MLHVSTIQYYLGCAGVYPNNYCKGPDMHQVTSPHTQSLTCRSNKVYSQTNVQVFFWTVGGTRETHADTWGKLNKTLSKLQ